MNTAPTATSTLERYSTNCVSSTDTTEKTEIHTQFGIPTTLAPSETGNQSWPLLPVETEIYILPDGRVVVADLPAELAPLLAALGATASSDVDPSDDARSCYE